MGKITCIGSSSKGNGYILDDGESQLIIELGCRFEDYLKVLDYKISDVCGCLVTHVHQDHSKYIPTALKRQIGVFSCQDVADHYSGVKSRKTGCKYRIGTFIVQPIKVTHSVENYAYVIDNDNIGRVLFITDCVRFAYKVKGVNHLLLEANYSDEIVIDHLCDNQGIRSQNQYHMEINDTLECIRYNFSQELNTICLLHLSDRQSDEFKFQCMVCDEFGIMPYIADKGLTIELNKNDF